MIYVIKIMWLRRLIILLIGPPLTLFTITIWFWLRLIQVWWEAFFDVFAEGIEFLRETLNDIVRAWDKKYWGGK